MGRGVLDNVTHALVGLLLAETVIARRLRAATPSPAFRRSACLSSMLANNVSDLDVLYAPRLGGKLGYLLHHRGHTHTLPIALLLGLAVFALSRVTLGRTALRLAAGESSSILGLCLAGPIVHIALDACNNYGVHPFWPFYNGWLYGDSLFVIEPWFWVLLVPALFARAETRASKWLLGSIFLLGLLLSFRTHIVPWGAALALTLGALVSVGLVRSMRVGLHLPFAASSSLLLLLVFLTGSRLARARVMAALEGDPAAANERVLDVVMTPMPGDPLCFSAIVVSLRGGEYFTRSGRAAVFPEWLSARDCRVQPTGLSLGLRASKAASSAGVYWEGEWSRPLRELAELARTNCEVAAMLHFSRVPFWKASRRERWLIGDLRFDRDPEPDFDEFYVPARFDGCGSYHSPWLSPRQDLWNQDQREAPPR